MSSVSSQVRDPGNGARWTLHPLIFSSLAHVRRASRLSLAATLGGGKTKRVTEPARLANLRATRARPPTPAKSQKAEQRQGSATAEPHRAVLSPGGAPSSVVRTLVQLGTSRSTRRRAGPRSGCDGHRRGRHVTELSLGTGERASGVAADTPSRQTGVPCGDRGRRPRAA